MKKPRHFFTCRRHQDREYAHVNVEIFRMPESDYQSGLNELFSVKWQSDADQSPPKWYAPHVEIRTDRPADVLPAAARLLARHPLVWDAAKYINNLMAAGIEHRIYDCRLSQYLPPSGIKPAEYRRWINDASRANDETLVSCLARDEEEAQKLLAAQFADLIVRYQQHCISQERATRQMQAWLEAQRPVKLVHYEHAPECTGLDEMLKPYGRPTLEPASIAV